MSLRSILIAICLLWTSADAIAQVVGSGVISGRVEDAEGAALPGVTLTVKGPGLAAEAISDGTGRFALEGLMQGPPATYTISASLPGFAPMEVRGVAANGNVVVTLSVQCAEPDLYVDLGIAEAFRSASGAFLLRIEGVAPARHWTVGTICGDATEHIATVFEAVKDTRSSAPTTLRFLVFKNYRYEVGADYLALLEWEPSVGRYQIFMPSYVLPVRGGIIECEALRTEFPCGSSVTETFDALRSLATQP